MFAIMSPLGLFHSGFHHSALCCSGVQYVVRAYVVQAKVVRANVVAYVFRSHAVTSM